MKGIQRWNKVRQRLSSITASGLDVSFISSPVHNKTYYSKITIIFFQVKLNSEIIWRFPKDSEQPNYCNRDGNVCYYRGDWITPEYPIHSIIKYLDLPKEQLLHYEDIAGLADILKVCDKRIGYERLKNIELSNAAKQIFDERFKEKLIKANETSPSL